MLIDGPWSAAARGAGLLRGSAVPACPDDLQPTIFARMSALAQKHGAINLGQGFPDGGTPQAVLDAACAAIRDGHNQYPPGPGTPVLREAIAEHHQRFYGIDLNPATEILVTTGATEALAATLLAFIRPGDEVLALEPFYDAYAAVVALAGGTLRTVPLSVSTTPDGDLDLRVDSEQFVDAMTDRTRIVLLNTPHNPTGLVLDRECLDRISGAAIDRGALIVTDEVYEHLTFETAHIPVAALPGRAEHTVSIGSAGKTFAVTGWKIGWVCAPAPLIQAITAVKQFLTFTSGAPFQPAVAAGLGLPDAEYQRIADDLHRGRDLLISALREVGFRVAPPEAGYFVVADGSPLGIEDADSWCLDAACDVGVSAIPVSALCHPGASSNWARPLIRFAFCKEDATLHEAAARLRRWAGR
ncbi:aminotransferase class I/II-fold pyridoxal phosphate-dependent enzyme [Devriesea agamarum]|uniref:aminotransferase class I/II-fold pyridoxal phosphate-dependent enzyme n=1 Tax=Devriesea agamarum TaxID=472569 RepID=UPI00071DAD4B|nr:aminotransferase class I/II-fold pyridoxal phosphate-dependent enzyme [Devriesea agamarum]